MACMVGCAVVATVPVMDGTASGDPAPAAKARTKHDSYGSSGASLLPVDLPPVDLPPVDLPPVEVPLPSVEVPPPPQLPGVPTLPPLSSLTS